MASTALTIALSPEQGLQRYLSEIRKFPMLGKEQEFMLAKRWQEHGDSRAAHTLVTSHLRLVAKIAMGYRGYGLPIGEVISEGNVGLMQAVKRFEPDKGFRLATYAMWWIRASIQEYILRSWSLVKMGTTANQKKLFFNLRKAKGRISALEEGDLKPDQVQQIATRLGVDPEADRRSHPRGDRARLEDRPVRRPAARGGRIGQAGAAARRARHGQALIGRGARRRRTSIPSADAERELRRAGARGAGNRAVRAGARRWRGDPRPAVSRNPVASTRLSNRV